MDFRFIQSMVKQRAKLLSTVIILLLGVPMVIAATAQELTYDANGNLVSGDGFYREYDGYNRLVRIREGNAAGGTILEEQYWDLLEPRVLVRRTFTAGTLNHTTYYWTDEFTQDVYPDGRVVNETDIQHNGKFIAQQTNNTVEFNHHDQLGSVIATTDSQGAVTSRQRYDPYGALLTTQSSQRKKYTGEELTTTTNTYDLGARHLNSRIGRLIQPDTVVQDIFVPQGFNRYAYVLNNPYKYVDPTGRNYILLVNSEGAGGLGHAAGIVYNDKYAVYYSWEATADVSLQTMAGQGEARLGEIGMGVMYEAASKDALLAEHDGLLDVYEKQAEFETTEEQDDAMKNKILDFGVDTIYNPLFDNCVQRQYQTMQAGGIKSLPHPVPNTYFYLNTGKLSRRVIDAGKYIREFMGELFKHITDRQKEAAENAKKDKSTSK